MSRELLGITLRCLFEVMNVCIFVRILVSYMNFNEGNRFVGFLHTVTEPILGPIRGVVERSSLGKNMTVDFSPIIALLLIELIRSFTNEFLPVG